jgi:hypothetical protein
LKAICNTACRQVTNITVSTILLRNEINYVGSITNNKGT